MKIKTQNIIYRKDLYPRFEPNQTIIERYRSAIEHLPPIKINQNNILIDGFHRWKAHELAELTEVEAEIINTESEAELKILAYKYNSIHGLQLTPDEKRIFACELIGIRSVKEISEILSVSEPTVKRWTETQRQKNKELRDAKIIDLYLKAESTQESIAQEMDITHQAISNIISAKKAQMSEICKDFSPYLYNIWNLQKMDTETSHFGAFPQIFMENLLYTHTNLLDSIYDPFAGSGTTVDVCRKMFRRYYCSDIKIKPGREEFIKQHDIAKGFPTNLPKIDMLFLDPPYWILADKEYSQSEKDLGNMNKIDFYKVMFNILREASDKKIDKIAYVIRPIWEIKDNEWIWEDPTFFFWKELSEKYNFESRYMLPYSTQQYTATMVEKAKLNNKKLITTRDLIVLKRRNK